MYLYIYVYYAHVYYLDVQKYMPFEFMGKQRCLRLALASDRLLILQKHQSWMDQMSTKSDAFWWLHGPYFAGGCLFLKRNNTHQDTKDKKTIENISQNASTPHTSVPSFAALAIL